MIVMTTVYFSENADHNLTGFVCYGHALFADKGKDILCAAISALTINTSNALEEIAKADLDINRNADDEVFAVSLRSKPDIRTETLLRSLELGLVELSIEYGSEYLKVTMKEDVKC